MERRLSAKDFGKFERRKFMQAVRASMLEVAKMNANLCSQGDGKAAGGDDTDRAEVI